MWIELITFAIATGKRVFWWIQIRDDGYNWKFRSFIDPYDPASNKQFDFAMYHHALDEDDFLINTWNTLRNGTYMNGGQQVIGFGRVDEEGITGNKSLNILDRERDSNSFFGGPNLKGTTNRESIIKEIKTNYENTSKPNGG